MPRYATLLYCYHCCALPWLSARQVLDPAGRFSHLDCWQSSPRIRAWLEKNFPGAEERHGDNAYVWFVDQISNILRNLGKRPMLWDDVSVFELVLCCANKMRPTLARGRLLIATLLLTSLAAVQVAK